MLKDDRRLEMIEARLTDLRGLVEQCMRTYVTVLEQQNRILSCENKIDIVYDRLLDLSQKESEMMTEHERVTKFVKKIDDFMSS